MIYKKYKLGELIEQYDEINVNGEFKSLDSLQGINSLKYFQECKSNKNDIDLQRYRICRRNMFAYNRATSRNGERISIAFREGNDCLISPSYYCFKIIRNDIIDSHYLMIWFKRPIFDKYARFNSWGSATEFFTFDDFCKTEIELPSIEEQKKLAYFYDTINQRIDLLIKIKFNLENQILCLFNSQVKEREVSLKELTKNYDGVKTGKGADNMAEKKCGKYIFPVIGASGIMGYTDKYLASGRIVSTGRVGTIGKVMLWDNKNWFTDNSIFIETDCVATVYCLLKKYNFDEILGGSSNPKITQTDLKNIRFMVPCGEKIIEFEKKTRPLLDSLLINEKEIANLKCILSSFLSNIK